MTRLFLLKLAVMIGCSISASSSYAQKDGDFRDITGRIVDFVSNQAIDSVKAELMTTDSTLVGDGLTYCDVQAYVKKSFYFFRIAKPGNYLMRFSHPDYETYYQPISIQFHKESKSYILLSSL